MLKKISVLCAVLAVTQAQAIQVIPNIQENLCSSDAVHWGVGCWNDGSSTMGVRVGARLIVDPADVGRPGAIGVTAYFGGRAYMLSDSGWNLYLGEPKPYAYYQSIPASIDLPNIYEGDQCAYQNAQIFVGYGVLGEYEANRIDNYHAQKNPKISKEHLIGLYTYLNGEKNQKYALVYDNTGKCSTGG